MKLVMDEKLKHRLIGLAVIISLGAIFAPAVMKKSSQHLDSNFSVNVKLPPKPPAPNVVITDEKDIFKTIKIAKVTIPSVSDKKQLPELVKAEAIKSERLVSANKAPTNLSDAGSISKPINFALSQSAKNSAKKSIQIATAKTVKNQTVAALKNKAKVISKANNSALVKTTQVAKNKTNSGLSSKSKSKQTIYAVQLASFSKRNNAQSLINQLRSKGYKANLTQSASQQGPVYKVHVGHSSSKNDVTKLKTQLATSMRINGFIVNTGIS